MAAPNSEPAALSLCKVLSESRRIIGLRPRHFQALSLLFLIPLSVVSLLYVITTQKKPHNYFPRYYSEENNIISSRPQTHQLFQSFLLSLFYALFSNLFTLFAAASVTYSAYRTSRDEPVDLISSLKSIPRAFWPLVSTTLVSGLIIFSITASLLILALLLYQLLRDTSYLVPSVVMIGVAFAVAIIYLQVNWMLAYAVVVVESKWGYAPLKRSADLVKGNRRVARSVILYFGLGGGCFLWSFSWIFSCGWGIWSVLNFLILMLCGSFFLSQVLLGNLVANVVLYVYCREAHEGVDPSDQNPQKFPLLQ